MTRPEKLIGLVKNDYVKYFDTIGNAKM